jgi:sugar phosphate isomerase/epimerase
MNPSSPVSRRRFLTATATVTTVGLLGTPVARTLEPLRRPGRSRLKLSLAAYSFREAFNHTDPARRLTLPAFLDYCADHGCDGAELTSYYFPKDFPPAFLAGLKRHAHLRGLDVSGTAVGNNFALPDGPERDRQVAQVKAWIDHAAALGAPHIRVFAGEAKGLDPAVAKRQCVRALEDCGEYAGSKGIWLGLENHGGIVADVAALLEIVTAVKSPWVGVNLDSGNFYSEANPYTEMARLAPYTVNAQLKVAISRPGRAKQPTDLNRFLQVLREANYQGYVALEYEEQDPEKEVPRWLEQMHAALAKG